MNLEPLTIAANVTQGVNVHCDQVLLLLGKLYHTFTINHEYFDDTGEAVDVGPVPSITNSINKHWAKADQDLFIVTFYLNPYLNKDLLNPSLLSAASIMGILCCLYICIFGVDSTPAAFLEEIFDYHQWQAMFSPENWPLDTLRQGLQDPVCLESFSYH